MAAEIESPKLGAIVVALFASALLALAVLHGGADSPPTVGTRLEDFQARWGLLSGVGIQNRPHSSRVRVWQLTDKHGAAPNADTPMALASLSKPLTARVIRTLAAERKLSLDDRIGQWLPAIAANAKDPRVRGITLRQLLHHTGGFDSARSGDPMFMGNQSEWGCETAITVGVLRRKLDFAPGTEIHYANVGYCLLGRVIERATGMSYDEALPHILGVGQGSTAGLVSLGPPRGATVMPTDLNLGAFGSAGGLVTSARTYIRVMRQEVKSSATIEEKPTHAHWTDSYYGLGWHIWPLPSGTVLTHFGALPQVFTFAAIYPSGCVAVVLFHGRPSNEDEAAKELRKILAC